MSLVFQTREERRWFADRFERLHQEEVSDSEKVAMATLMLKAQVDIMAYIVGHHNVLYFEKYREMGVVIPFFIEVAWTSQFASFTNFPE